MLATRAEADETARHRGKERRTRERKSTRYGRTVESVLHSSSAFDSSGHSLLLSRKSTAAVEETTAGQRTGAQGPDREERAKGAGDEPFLGL